MIYDWKIIAVNYKVMYYIPSQQSVLKSFLVGSIRAMPMYRQFLIHRSGMAPILSPNI